MAGNKYTAPNDFRAFCEALGETEASMCHHGIKGQRWGIRRFQNEDGTLTSKGKVRYYDGKTGEKTDTHMNISMPDKKAVNEAKKQLKNPETKQEIKELMNITKNFQKSDNLQDAIDGIQGMYGIKTTKEDVDHVLNMSYPTRFDGKKYGCTRDITLKKIHPDYEYPEKSTATYETECKSKGTNVPLQFDVGTSMPYRNVKHSVTSLKEAANTIGDSLKKDKFGFKRAFNEAKYSDEDVQHILSNAQVWHCSMHDPDGKHGRYGLVGQDKNGKKHYAEGAFITTASGKIIPVTLACKKDNHWYDEVKLSTDFSKGNKGKTSREVDERRATESEQKEQLSFSEKIRMLMYFNTHAGEDYNLANTWRESKAYSKRMAEERAKRKETK